MLHLADVDLPSRVDAAQPAVDSTGQAHEPVAASAALAAARPSLASSALSAVSSAAVGRLRQAVCRPRRELHGLKVLHGLVERRLLPEANALLCRVPRLRRVDGHRLLDVCRLADVGVALPGLVAGRATAQASGVAAQAADAAQIAPSTGAASAAALATVATVAASSEAAAATAEAAWRAAAATAASVPVPRRLRACHVRRQAAAGKMRPVVHCSRVPRHVRRMPTPTRAVAAASVTAAAGQGREASPQAQPRGVVCGGWHDDVEFGSRRHLRRGWGRRAGARRRGRGATARRGRRGHDGRAHRRSARVGARAGAGVLLPLLRSLEAAAGWHHAPSRPAPRKHEEGRAPWRAHGRRGGGDTAAQRRRRRGGRRGHGNGCDGLWQPRRGGGGVSREAQRAPRGRWPTDGHEARREEGARPRVARGEGGDDRAVIARREAAYNHRSLAGLWKLVRVAVLVALVYSRPCSRLRQVLLRS